MTDSTDHTTTDTTTEVSTPQPGELIRAKWSMDGASTLEEAAQRLEAYAHHLRRLHQQGWTLADPIEDDYGTLTDPNGNIGNLTDDAGDDSR